MRRLNGVLSLRSGSLFDLNYFAAFVVAALGADAMLHSWFLTIWTGDGLRHPQRIVCPALAAARFRVTTFWIWHDYSTILVSDLDFKFQILDFEFQISNFIFEIRVPGTLYSELGTLKMDSGQTRNSK